MDKSKSEHRRKLNAEQVEVLELLYKFRFGSNNLLADYFGKKDRSFVFNRLKILVERGYVGKRFESSYRIRGMSAAYYLLPDGARELAKYREPDDDEVNIKALYRDKSVKEPFIQHCFKIFHLYNQLTDEYGDALSFLTKSDLAGVENHPSPLPDAVLVLEEGDEERTFFVDILEDSLPAFVYAKRIKQYIEYWQSGDWAVIGGPFPKVIFVCESERLRKQVEKRARAILNKAWVHDVEFVTATKDTIELG